MKKLTFKLLAVCLIFAILSVSSFAYTIPRYAVSLKTTDADSRIYEGENIEIYININSEDFLMTDMVVGYAEDFFEIASGKNGTVEFEEPEIKDAALADGDDSYDLTTKFTFKANEVDDTVKKTFTIDAADIVHSYESAKADEPTNVEDRTNIDIIIVKQYDVAFEEEDGTTISETTVDKGLDEENEADTALVAPDVADLYEKYVEAGLDAAYYEHVWNYKGNEYTNEEIAAFGQGTSSDEITEDTTFVLDVRAKTFDVIVPANDFDTASTHDQATYGTDYSGKVKDYNDIYDYTVKYDIAGTVDSVECVGDSFTIPGEKIVGNMTLTLEKKLNIEIEAYKEYLTGYFLITVKGNAAGYTFDGNEMYISENHENLRAWIYADTSDMSEEEVEILAEGLIRSSSNSSDTAPSGCDINESGNVDLSDAALAYGAYVVELMPVNEWIKEYLTADINKDYQVDTSDYDLAIEAYKQA